MAASQHPPFLESKLTKRALSPCHPLDLASQECRCRGGVDAVCQMCGSDDKSAAAHEISNSAEDLRLGSWVPRDLSAILQVTGKSKQHNALDLRNNSGVQRLNRVIHHSGALAVTSGNDLGVRALRVSEVEEVVGSADGSG